MLNNIETIQNCYEQKEKAMRSLSKLQRTIQLGLPFALILESISKADPPVSFCIILLGMFPRLWLLISKVLSLPQSLPSL